MTTIKFGVACEVKQTGTKFYYWHYMNARWMPVKKVEVVFA